MAKESINLVLISILLVNAVLVLGESEDVQFLMQPKNATVFEGGTLFIPCNFKNSDATPSWNIEFKNGSTLTVSSSILPPKHYYNGSGMILKDIEVALNQTTYTCYLITVIKGMRGFSIAKSTEGTITVIGSNPQSFMLKFNISIILLLILLHVNYTFHVIIYFRWH